MPRALSILTAAVALAAAIACGSTSSTTVAGPSPAKCQLTATNSTPNFTATGGQGAIVVQAARECAWTAAAQVNWVALMPPMDGQGDSTLKYNVQPNPSGLPRQGTVNVAGQIVQVGQAGAACRFDLDRRQAQIAAAVTSVDVNVQGPTGCAWTAASEADWLSVTQGAQGSGPGRVTLRALANPGAARVGTVLIAGIRFEVTQVSASGPPPPPPAGCTYALLPASAQLDSAAAEGTLSLTTGGDCPWLATSDQPWLSVLSATSGTGNAQITYRVAANDTGATRTAQITVGTAAFIVLQAAAGAPPPPACTFDVSPNGPITADADGESGTIRVTTAATCVWTASASASWIQLTGSGGAGTGQVDYQIEANAGTSERTGTITVAGTTLTVTQAGAALPSITLTGDAASVSGTCPAVTFILEGRTVSTSSATNFRGGNCPRLKDGEPVIVRGLLTLEGTVDATELEFVR
jgi:hypothetical protein